MIVEEVVDPKKEVLVYSDSDFVVLDSILDSDSIDSDSD